MKILIVCCLIYSFKAEFSLEDILQKLSSRYTQITDLIPNRYNFQDGETGNEIEDGGNDIFDHGNKLRTNLQKDFQYTNGVITNNSSAFGLNSRYFTKKYPGLFMMAADNTEATYFQVWSDYGSDDEGEFSFNTFTYYGAYDQYTSYSHRIFGTTDPSVNQLIIFKTLSGGQFRQEDNQGTENGVIGVDGMQLYSRIYYFLFSSNLGMEINVSQTELIFQAIIKIIDLVCHFSCRDCIYGNFLANQCTSCDAEMHRIQIEQSCVCKDGYFQPDDKNYCQVCKNQCLTCSDANSCKTCIQGDSRSKIPPCMCQENFYDNAGVCTICTSPCQITSLENMLLYFPFITQLTQKLIPNMFVIQDQQASTWQQGVFLSTEVEDIEYQVTGDGTGAILKTSAYGVGSRYFTKIKDGIFMMAADNCSFNQFKVFGNLRKNVILFPPIILYQSGFKGEYTLYNYVVQDYDCQCSINEIIIFKTLNGTQQVNYSTKTYGSGYLEVNGMINNSDILFLRFATSQLNNLNNQAIKQIFISIIKQLELDYEQIYTDDNYNAIFKYGQMTPITSTNCNVRQIRYSNQIIIMPYYCDGEEPGSVFQWNQKTSCWDLLNLVTTTYQKSWCKYIPQSDI